jgi:putative DNA methylase
MWLWTLSTSGTDPDEGLTSEEEAEEDATDVDDEETSGRAAKGEGFSLEFDAARKIAQGLGANLEDLRTVVEVKGKTARLLSVSERARTLFGKGEGPGVTVPKKSRGRAGFLKGMEDAGSAVPTSESWDELGPPRPGATALDRVHQAMILFGRGQAEALKRFVVEEGAGTDARFWKLAQSLSALYPPGTNEKRWVDGVLARKKGLGF